MYAYLIFPPEISLYETLRVFSKYVFVSSSTYIAIAQMFSKYNPRQFVTGDETCVHYFEPVRKIGNKIWLNKHGRRIYSREYPSLARVNTYFLYRKEKHLLIFQVK
jgi:hypothetical protein